MYAGNNVSIRSCIIWIEDVEIEEAVEAGIDAAERMYILVHTEQV